MKFLNGYPVSRIVILTGAGVSAESGLATFRDPVLVYRFYNARRNQLRDVVPNAAHRALAQLQVEFRGEVFLVTQNVDDLHERGGSKQVCHMHGELNSMWKWLLWWTIYWLAE